MPRSSRAVTQEQFDEIAATAAAAQIANRLMGLARENSSYVRVTRKDLWLELFELARKRNAAAIAGTETTSGPIPEAPKRARKPRYTAPKNVGAPDNGQPDLVPPSMRQPAAPTEEKAP